MKKYIALILGILLILSTLLFLCSCGNGEGGNTAAATSAQAQSGETPAQSGETPAPSEAATTTATPSQLAIGDAGSPEETPW